MCIEQDGVLSPGGSRRVARRLNEATAALRFVTKPAPAHRRQAVLIRFSNRVRRPPPPSAPVGEAYELTIDRSGVQIGCVGVAGARHAAATLCQLLRQYGRRLPCLTIRDWPDFPRRGVMLDVSRGRVPKLATLRQLATDLAGFKINELQLYLEHTFAYRAHAGVWREGEALTGEEIRALDAHCRNLGIDLVPNQNSFGHLRHWFEHERYKPLAEVQAPYPGPDGSFLRYPSTLAPNHRGTLSFLRTLYDELLPHFSSRFFNVGCDETWDLGRGQSRVLCRRKGQGRVYLDFLLKVHREVQRHGRTMMFWGDILLNYPNLIAELPKELIALNWGYEADHPFAEEAAAFERAGLRFYVCPGTSTWQTLIGRNDNAFANLRAAARAGRRHGAIGYLITDWGDGAHPQPLAVSYPAFLTGAALAWCARTFRAGSVAHVLSRDVFQDPTGHLAHALMRLGVAHRKFGYREPNATPFGAPLAAPPSEDRELFCRNGLKYYARLSPRAIRSAEAAVATERKRLAKARPITASGRLLARELDLAARMAQASCHYMLWQQALAKGHAVRAQTLTDQGLRDLRELKRDVKAYWAHRCKGTPSQCVAFLDWRIEDYRRQRLHFAPAEAELA